MKKLKRIICMLLCSCCLISLVACGKQTKKSNEVEKSKTILDMDDIGKIEWSNEDTQAMSNYMNHKKVLCEGAWIYSDGFDDDCKRYFYKIKKDGTEKTKLSSSIVFQINIYSNWIYFISADNKIKRVKMSGESEETIVSLKKGYDSLYQMFIYDDKIYYVMYKKIDDEHYESFLYRCSMSGENTEIVVKGAIYFPYIIDNHIYYQDAENSRKLTRCNLDGSNPQVLCEDKINIFIYDGEKIYYNAYIDSEESQLSLNCIDINGKNKETIIEKGAGTTFAVSEDFICYVDFEDDFRLYKCDKKGKNIENVTQKNHIVAGIFLYDKYLFFEQHDENWEFTNGIFSINLDGTNLRRVF